MENLASRFSRYRSRFLEAETDLNALTSLDHASYDCRGIAINCSAI